MFKRKCKITFISHGSTIYSEDNRLTDKLDYPPLNENGYNELRKIVDFIKTRGLKTNKIYASPALATVQSAEILADELKQDFETLPDLYNRKCGIWSGLSFSQIEKKYPDMLDQLHLNPLGFCPENGENIQDFNNRVNEIITKIIDKNLRGRVIIVTHPSIIQSAIKSALNIPAENQYKIYIRPASATQISYYEDWASLIYSGYKPL